MGRHGQTWAGAMLVLHMFYITSNSLNPIPGNAEQQTFIIDVSCN